MQYASFLINDNLYGIPIFLVQEFTRSLPIYPIPGHDHRIAGCTNLRGRIALAIDLNQSLSESNKAPRLQQIGENKKMIILETNDRLVKEAVDEGLESHDEPLVLLVDKIHKVIQVNLDTMYPAPAHIEKEYVDGMANVEGQSMTLLHVKKLITMLIQSRKEQSGPI